MMRKHHSIKSVYTACVKGLGQEQAWHIPELERRPLQQKYVDHMVTTVSAKGSGRR